MHRSESAELIDCCDCGANISPATDRPSASVRTSSPRLRDPARRGLRRAEERWTVAPNLSGIPHEWHIQP